MSNIMSNILLIKFLIFIAFNCVMIYNVGDLIATNFQERSDFLAKKAFCCYRHDLFRLFGTCGKSRK